MKKKFDPPHEMIVIAGPTGSGKTDLVCNLDNRYFEAVSFDSRQVYTDMSIGTAAPTAAELAKIRHHLVQIIPPDEQINAARFSLFAEEAVNDIYSRKKVPVLICGTGFYLRAFLYGMYPVPEITPEVKKIISNLSKKEKAYMLEDLDPEAMAKLSPNDDYRITRALEVNLSGTLWSQITTESSSTGYMQHNSLEITGILLSPPREELYNRLNERAKRMLEQGMLEETESVKTKYGEDCQGLKTLGYNFALEIISGHMSLETGYEKLAQSHRNYAKKQITWFKKEPLLTPLTIESAMILLKNIEKRFKNVS